jgi:phospho-N-acetylmuramoyl-pentapeptide-transferase
MLLALANWIASDVRTFNVFGYITLRAVLATMTALMISFVVGPKMIGKLAQYKIGQSVRDDGPVTHLTKAGTPTMGGALILVSITITTLLWADLRNRFVWVVLLVTIGFGAIGWIDDYRKSCTAIRKVSSARAKLFWQSVIGPRCRRVPRVFGFVAFDRAGSAALFTWLSSGFNLDLPPGRFDRAFFKTVSYSARRLGLHCSVLLRHRRPRATRSISPTGSMASPSCRR